MDGREQCKRLEERLASIQNEEECPSRHSILLALPQSKDQGLNQACLVLGGGYDLILEARKQIK